MSSLVWKRIEGQLLWKNQNTGEWVSVSGSEDQAFYVVKHAIPVGEGDIFGRMMNTITVSPYYISQNKKPVGEYGRASQNSVKVYNDWVYSQNPMREAVNFALKYMNSHKERTKMR